MSWFSDLGNFVKSKNGWKIFFPAAYFFTETDTGKDIKDVILNGETEKEREKKNEDEKYWRDLISTYTPYVLGSIGVVVVILILK